MSEERRSEETSRPEPEALSPVEGESLGPDGLSPPDSSLTPEEVEELHADWDEGDSSEFPRRPRLTAGPRKGRRLVKKQKPAAESRQGVTKIGPEQRLIILDTWQRSGLPAGDFAPLVGISKHTLYTWEKKFEEHGPAGLVDRPRGGPRGSRMSATAKRAILMIKKAHPEYGTQRISDELARGPGLGASPKTVAKILKEAGYEMEEVTTRPHPDKVRRFERARPNQMWQTDIFTFMLKRQNRRVHLVGFLDDHSRFMVGYGLYTRMSTALVLEVLGAGIASYGPPEEILTDNGPQYKTWRGKSAFTKELEKRGIRQVVAKPRRPRTLGKVERFWATLWRECVETAIFLDLEDARKRIGLFIDHYNFQRPHQGIDGLAPADRFFHAAEEVKKTLQSRVSAQSLELARNGLPKKPFYMTGNVGGKSFSVHAEGERVFMIGEDGTKKEVDLSETEISPARSRHGVTAELPAAVCPTGSPPSSEVMDEVEPAPGTSPLDEGLKRIAESLESNETEGATDERDEG